MILLDTCVLLWIAADKPLPQSVTAALRRESWAVSSLSAWEIGLKHALAKLPLPQSPDRWWPRAVEVFGLQVEDFSAAQALRAASLPPLHNDPFDRGLIATALDRGMSLVSIDRALHPYRQACGVDLIDGL